VIAGSKETVIPAQAGIHLSSNEAVEEWIPAFAGMTSFGLMVAHLIWLKGRTDRRWGRNAHGRREAGHASNCGVERI